MTGNPTESVSSLPDWTRELLGAEEETGVNPIRSASFERLEEYSFLPSPDLYAALHVGLSDQLLPGDRVIPVAMCWEAQERSLRRRLDDFAADYFSWDPPERLARWQELHALLNEHPVLRRRSKELELGLSIEKQSLESLEDDVRSLGRRLLDMYVMRTAERIVERREWMTEVETDRTRWIMAARALRRKVPNIAALDSELLDWVIQPPKKPKRLFRRSPKTEPTPEKTSSTGVWIFVGCLFVAIRLISLANDTSSSSITTQYRPDDASISLHERMKEHDYYRKRAFVKGRIPLTLSNPRIGQIQRQWNTLLIGQIMDVGSQNFKIQKLPSSATIYHKSEFGRTSLSLPRQLMRLPKFGEGEIDQEEFEFYLDVCDFLETQVDRIDELVDPDLFEAKPEPTSETAESDADITSPLIQHIDLSDPSALEKLKQRLQQYRVDPRIIRPPNNDD